MTLVPEVPERISRKYLEQVGLEELGLDPQGDRILMRPEEMVELMESALAEDWDGQVLLQDVRNFYNSYPWHRFHINKELSARLDSALKESDDLLLNHGFTK